MRLPVLLPLITSLFLAGCAGPISLHEAVLGYDEITSRLDREMLLINVARKQQNLPSHFTVTSSIAATFDYRTNAGFSANLFENPGSNNSYGLSLGASAAENPTLSIVPIQGEDFTKRILAPMDESKFEFLVIQGAPIDMVLRLMARGFEVQNRDGTFQRFILNSPTAPKEYEEFRQRAMHLAWLNSNRKVFVSTLSYYESVPFPGSPSAGDLMAALDKGYSLQRPETEKEYRLNRTVKGRVVITNYDPRMLNDAERQRLNALASANPSNFILVDIRPDHPGGDFPLFGAMKLRSLNMMLTFIAAGISKSPEFQVAKDPRTGDVGLNPARVLAVEESDSQPGNPLLSASYLNRYYSIPATDWDRQAFTILYQLFQMTVTDVAKVGIPVTIGK